MATATNFDRLLKLGQQEGGLTTDDLVRALPIEAMTVEEIASLITRLEGANVPVEVDPALLSPMHRATLRLRLKLKPHPDGGAGATRDGSHAPSRPRPPSGGVARSSRGNRWRTGPYQGGKVLVIAAAIIVVFVLVVVLVLSAFRVG